MNIHSTDRRDFLARATHTLNRALSSTLVAATSGTGKGIVVHVLRGADPAELVHIARSLLEQAEEWMEGTNGILDAQNGGTRHPMYNAVSDCVGLLDDWDHQDGE